MPLWKLVLVMKYGEEWGDSCTKNVHGTHGCGLWKGINMGREGFLHYIPFEVGEGSQFQFWQDSWCGDQPLSMAVPDLYDFSLACGALAESFLRGQSDGEPRNWDASFLRF